MRTIKIMAAAALVMLGLAACQKEAPVAANVAWAPASASAVFSLGESQNIAANAENIDYVEVSSKPEGWTVNATVTSISIKAPAGTEKSFDLSGVISLKAVNREQEKSIPATINVSVDESKINGVVNITSDVKYTTVFSPGMSLDFEFSSAFVKSLEVSCASGWKAELDQAAGKVTVTAPRVAPNEKVNLSSTITISGKSITGKDIAPVSFEVALEAYLFKEDIFDPAIKAFKVLSPDGGTIAFAARQEGSMFVYMGIPGGMGDGIELAKGKPFVIVGGDTPTTQYEGNPLEVSAVPYVVTDIEGNEYNTLYVDGYLWMDENLRVTKNPAGEDLAEYGVPGGIEGNQKTYGYLYSKAVAFNGEDPESGFVQGICPNGWHIPVDHEIAPDLSFADVVTGDAVDCNPDLYASVTRVLPGMYTVFYNNPMYLVYDQGFAIQVCSSVYIFTGVPEMGGNGGEIQVQPAFSTSVRCVKNTNPLYVGPE